MGVIENLREHRGCARTRDVARSRSEARELGRLTEIGAVVRVARGVYSLPGADAAVVAARRLSGLVTCVSLAARLGLPLVDPAGTAHVAVPSSRGSPRAGARAGAVVHWDCAVQPDGLRAAVDVPRALRHALDCLPLREVVALGDAALNQGLVSRVELDAQRPAGGRLRFDRFIRHLDGRSQSLPETFLRLGLGAAGLEVEPQVLVDGVGWVDMLIDGVVVVEVDGFAYHAGRREFREDRRRDRVAQLHGLPVLRFTYRDAVHGTSLAVEEVVEAVERQRRAVALGLGVAPGATSRGRRDRSGDGRSVRRP